MVKENQLFDSMLGTARLRLTGRDAREIARRAGVSYGEGAFRFKSLGREVEISYPGLEVSPALEQWHLLTLLHYLDIADGTPPTGKQMPFSRCRDGMVRGGGFDRDAESLIEKKIGPMGEAELMRRCRALGAAFIPSNADLCARFDFAPGYPLWLKLWFADEEFPASGRLLIDEAADHYLTIEDAVTAGMVVLNMLAGGL